MNVVSPQPVLPDDEVDAQLRAFFQGEMPNPWPAFQPPQARSQARLRPFPAPQPKRRLLLRSRLALAASVGLLIFSGLMLPGRFPGARPEIGVKGGDASHQPPHAPGKSGSPGTEPDPKPRSTLFLEQGNEGGRIGIIVEGAPGR
jgi:hypothetical protein